MKEKCTKNIFLSLGSNLGERIQNINSALELIQSEIGPVKVKSSLFETEPWGDNNQSMFINMVTNIDSSLSPEEVLHRIHSIESRQGRIRHRKWEPRVIDIDIIYFDRLSIVSDNLMIPHGLMQKRKFVLVPLVEIAPDFVHPVLLKNNKALLSECEDKTKVRLL